MMIEARFCITKGAFDLDVALNIPARGVTAIFGPSGCGKTTLLRLLAGLDHDPAGFLSVSGDVWQKNAKFIPTHRRAVGYVFQEASLFAHLTVRGNLQYGFKRVRASNRQVSFSEAVSLLGLAGVLDRRPGGLSGGERQRVAIARTLLTSPRCLLMDEPLTGLDAESRSEIIPYLERLHGELEIPMLYVSHSFEEVARLADHLVLMKGGLVLASGPFLEVVNRLDSPLIQATEAESVLEARVASHDTTYHLTRLDVGARQLVVTEASLPIGGRVRVRVLARDVSLTLERPSHTSILNILPATVLALRDVSTGQMMVSLDIGGGISLLARITRKSAVSLGIAPGRSVFAQVKSVALLGPYRQDCG